MINLRSKAASMCWREDHLAALLYLCRAPKFGCWDAFMFACAQGRYWLAVGAIPESETMREAA